VARNSDFFFRELKFQPQRIGEAIGQIGQAGQHVNVNDLWIRKVLRQGREVAVADVTGGACEFVYVGERYSFLFAEP